MTVRYLLFTVKCRGDNEQQFLIDKEMYPDFYWDMSEAHSGYHPAYLCLNYNPGVKRVHIPWDSISWFRLDMGNTVTHSSLTALDNRMTVS